MKPGVPLIGRIRGAALSFVRTYLKTFRRKAISVAIPGLVLASVVYTADALRTEQKIMKDAIIKRAEVVTELASQIAVLPLISGNPDLVEEAVSVLKGISEVAFVAFYDAGMNALTEASGFPEEKQIYHEQARMEIFEGADYFDVRAPVFQTKTKEDIGLFFEPDVADESRELVGWVRIAFSKADMKAARTRIIMRGLVIAVIFTLGSSFVVYRLFSLATRPLSALSSAVRSLRNGKYPEVTVHSEDEIGQLAEEFNRMSNAINEREEMLMNGMLMSQFIAEIGIALSESTTLQEMLQRCTKIMITYTDASLALAWVYDKDADVLNLEACAGMYSLSECPRRRVSLGESSAGRIAQERRLSTSGNIIEDPRFDEFHWQREYGVMSYSGYPMIVESRLIGVLELFSSEPFNERLLDTLVTVADQTALGIERKIIDEKIRRSLEEKEVLLREVHHRVKNNMQVISSLLNLQSETVTDSRYREMFNESKNRIRAMALIHEKLYRTSDLEKIDFHDYIESLASSLTMFYRLSGGQVRLLIDARDIALGIDTAIPCGLIINELLSNALKYAFPDGRGGEIRIMMKKLPPEGNGEGKYFIEIADNGIGVPESFDMRNTKSLGMHLVTSLVEHQLQGEVVHRQDKGTVFSIIFRDVAHRRRI